MSKIFDENTSSESGLLAVHKVCVGVGEIELQCKPLHDDTHGTR